MNDPDDTDDVLHRFITDDHAERLLAGHADVDDGELAVMAGLFTALRAPAQPAELAGTDELVARMATAVRHGRTEPAPRSKRKLITAKVAVLATAVVFSAGAAAAAATGNLPERLQRTVSQTLSHVGLEVPSPQDGPDTPTDPAVTTTATGAPHGTTTPTSATHEAVGPDATSAAGTALCTAYLANDGHGNSRDAVAFENLTDAATNAGQTVTEFCTPTTTTTTTTTTTGGAAEPAEPANRGSTPAATAPGKPDEPGNSGSTPAATAPHNSGSTPAATAAHKPTDPGNNGTPPAATTPDETTHTTNGHRRP